MLYFDFHHHNSNTDFGIYNLKFNDELPKTYFSAGIHPDSISEDLEQKFDWLERMALLENCVAIGECGLDARYENADLQKHVFEKQIMLANEVQKPLIIHCVKSFPAIIEICRNAAVRVVIHGFNKRKTIGDELLEKQFMLSFGKSLMYNVNLQAFFKAMPPNRFFIETDSADIEIEKLYRKAAELRNITIEELNLQIPENLKSINLPFQNG
ncbi:TatD family hydrolase [Kaistella pullorum]|uniref:TatD family hydrolase n=1 Tax=Kaistella pullorum TaxID=2763074 RepID=A0ABR8WK38_9FLAO|nr:TatD family hydrolase [Kaistella pullorum]MBD8017302.1 TatD family hydrolase [Kaistella pullorum]